jgi:YHS domain-containing protein
MRQFPLRAGTLFMAAVALALFSGCRRESPAAANPPQASAPAAPPQVEAAIAQTTCPVMGGPIDKAIFTEYKGKRVYFCCRGCDKKFLEAPEKYIAKLPQFQN